MFIFIHSSLVEGSVEIEKDVLEEDDLRIVSNTGYHIINDKYDLDLFRSECNFCPLELISVAHVNLIGNFVFIDKKGAICNTKLVKGIKQAG